MCILKRTTATLGCISVGCSPARDRHRPTGHHRDVRALFCRYGSTKPGTTSHRASLENQGLIFIVCKTSDPRPGPPNQVSVHTAGATGPESASVCLSSHHPQLGEASVRFRSPKTKVARGTTRQPDQPLPPASDQIRSALSSHHQEWTRSSCFFRTHISTATLLRLLFTVVLYSSAKKKKRRVPWIASQGSPR